MVGEIDLVRALALAGIRSAVMAQPGNPARYSRATVARVPWTDPWTTPADFVGRLVAFAREQPEPPVLYYDGDWDALVISRERARLAPHLRFVLADGELVEDMLDKIRFQRVADRLSLAVPPAHSVTSEDARAGATDLRFPILAKPLIRQHATWRALSRTKAVRLPDREALRRLGAQLPDGLCVLLQEVIPGAESRIESYHVYVDSDGAIAGEFTGRKIRTWPTEFGYSTALEITRADDVSKLGRDVTRKIGLTGVAKLDFKRGPDGRLHLLEVNPRFNLWHHPGALAGVNIPALVHADLMGDRRPAATMARAGVRWCSPYHDIVAARANGVRARDWAGWLARVEAKSGFAWDDPAPLARAAAWRLRQAVGRRVRTRP